MLCHVYVHHTPSYIHLLCPTLCISANATYHILYVYVLMLHIFSMCYVVYTCCGLCHSFLLCPVMYIHITHIYPALCYLWWYIYATCIPYNRLYSWHLLHSRQHSVLSSHSRASHSTAYLGVLYQRCPAPPWSHFTPLVLSCWGTKAQPHYQAVHTPVWGSLLWPLNSVTGKLPSDPLSGKDRFITELCLTPAVAAVHSPAEPLVW